MEINSKNYKSKLNTLNKDKLNEKAAVIIPAVLGFIADQANEHGNYAPLTFLHDTVGKLIKPQEFKTLNRKNIREYAESIGLELRKDSRAFGMRKGANGGPFDPNFYQEFEVPAEPTPAEKFEKAVKKAKDDGLTMEQLLEIVGSQFDVEIAEVSEAA
jgi:hypothetical protein